MIGSTLANTLQHRRTIGEDILSEGYSAENERMARTTYHSVAQLRTELAQFANQVTVHGLTGPRGAHRADRRPYKNVPLPASIADPDPPQTAPVNNRNPWAPASRGRRHNATAGPEQISKFGGVAVFQTCSAAA